MFSYSTQRTMALEFVLQGLMALLLASYSLCLSFQICEMGTRLGWVGITGHLETGLSGQPEVLSGHLPAGVRGRHIGKAKATPQFPFGAGRGGKSRFLEVPGLAGVPLANGVQL